MIKEDNSELIIGYLQGRLNKQGVEDFYVWVNECPENKSLYFETKAIYDACASSSYVDDIEASWKRLLLKKETKQAHLRPFWYQIGSYVAVGLIAVMLTSVYFFFFPHEESVKSIRYFGGNGLEADVVELPDGTFVSLGSKTTFHYDTDYGKKDRMVYLEGEAFFQVAKEIDKPFVVKTKEQDIQALGTKFNVSAYPYDSLLTTTLLQGSVLLTTTGITEKTLLKPNEQLVYNRNTRHSSVQIVDAKQFMAWTTGYYYFPEQSLEAILYRLGHVYGVQFTVLSEKLNQRIFTGTFYRGQSIKDIMEIIHLSIPINYEIKDHQVTISEI